jgi:hypothetical protein
MAELFPTKELLQMIEDRVPGGRILTTAALVLAVLAITVASCVYLYHIVILPFVTFVIAGLTTGKINPTVFSSFIASGICGAVIFGLLEWMVRGSSRLMREMLDHSTHVLKSNTQVLSLAGETNRQLVAMAEMIRDMEARIKLLED